MRVGFGFDAHELVGGKRLILGGVQIEFEKGLRGHSDGDVVLHALSDALLGSCAGGDIGMYFRDDDGKIEGIDSRRILEFALQKAHESGLKIHNIDLVLVADRPKLSGLYDAIRRSMSECCGVGERAVSVKAKTTEGTMVGKDAIACFAIALMDEL
jgi:2-C-methyl-D-erythritol 2,4-cyclodiphosphate synthase